ncbi:hypothetical protein BDB00DRAFT_173349 [Zychaea mexicana]|uniref:uncharacterized protein n=1 Tax=Zychaea mexicana TaxID=64656 RepID=UPI0022FECCCA|nr:uncharacterized protein BDB00DRAFT_173349 [Zychaea mexicana]KAI9479635.1 hypothetical protein BDB00DRAFT_173349 [Zychaea mexicana]
MNSRHRNQPNSTLPTVTEALSAGNFDYNNNYLCKRCCSEKPGMDFSGNTRPYRTCVACRTRDTPPEIVPLDDMVILDSLYDYYPAADDTNDHFYCYIMVELYMESISIDQLIERILDEVISCNGHRYMLKNEGAPEQAFNLTLIGMRWPLHLLLQVPKTEK